MPRLPWPSMRPGEMGYSRRMRLGLGIIMGRVTQGSLALLRQKRFGGQAGLRDAIPLGLEKARSSEFSGEGLVQQRLLQRLQRGELPLVEMGEALGFGGLSYPNGVIAASPATESARLPWVNPVKCHQPQRGNGAYTRNRTELSGKVEVWNEGWSLQVETKVSPFRQQIWVGLARWKPAGTFFD